MLRFLLTSLSFAFSLLIFQRGFLLKRQELHLNSTCADAKVLPNGCWMPKQHDKVVFILVDALRHDFLVPPRPDDPPTNYRGQMPQVEKLLSSGASIGTIIADPPTTTLQRIKALTTGTLPTFIDAGDNFSPDARVLEDNFLAQAKTMNRTTAFFGDDTWLSLYPNHFTVSKAFPSFDVNDLTTVDYAVNDLLQDYLVKEKADLVIGHVLGVDHCGHKFGPLHPMMGNTLRRTDEMIGAIANKLAPNDILIVIGDHGMTITGDHGGDSDDETHAGIMVYSPGRKLVLPPEPFRQIDLVPTLSLFLGLPIPFSNLGTVVQELFVPEFAERAVTLNYEQIMRFATTYASSYGFGDLYTVTSHDALNIQDQLRMIAEIQRTLRTAWTKFDWPLMRTGLVSLLEIVLVVSSGRAMDAPEIIVRSGCLLLQASVLFGSSSPDNALALLMLVLPLSVVYSVGHLLYAFMLQPLGSPTKAISMLAVVVHGLSYLSNSFVVYEGHLLRFLISGILVFACYCKYRAYWAKIPRIMRTKSRLWTNDLTACVLALAALRCEPYFHRCREEEVDCVNYYPVQILGSLSADAAIFRCIVAIVSQFALDFWIRRTLLKSQEAGLTRAIGRVALLAIALHQLLQATVAIGSLPGSTNYQAHLNVIARTVYACSLCSILWTLSHIRYFSTFECKLSISYSLLWSFLLLVGDGIVPAVVAFVVLTGAALQLCDEECLPWICSLLISIGFYYTGHSPTLTAIPWHAAFVGIPGNFPYQALPATLVFVHLFISIPLVLFALVLHPSFSSTTLHQLLAASSIPSLLVSFAAFIHRRHLMVWKIFAPKFIFEGISFLVLLLVILLVRLFVRVKS